MSNNREFPRSKVPNCFHPLRSRSYIRTRLPDCLYLPTFHHDKFDFLHAHEYSAGHSVGPLARRSCWLVVEAVVVVVSPFTRSAAHSRVKLIEFIPRHGFARIRREFATGFLARPRGMPREREGELLLSIQIIINHLLMTYF